MIALTDYGLYWDISSCYLKYMRWRGNLYDRNADMKYCGPGILTLSDCTFPSTWARSNPEGAVFASIQGPGIVKGTRVVRRAQGVQIYRRPPVRIDLEKFQANATIFAGSGVWPEA
jgi:hypothetical protein